MTSLLHDRVSARRVLGAGAAAMVFFGLATVAATDAGARPALDTVCQGPRAEMAAINQEIQAHNSKPHLFELPREQAGFDAYNAEAAQLEARGQAIQVRLDSCLVAAVQLSGSPNGPGIPAAMPANLPQLIKSARHTAPSRQQQVEELVGIFDDAAQEYDDEWTNQVLQNKRQPKVGDADPAVPGATIGADEQGDPQVTPDYVIPLSDILEMPKFMDLNPESQWMAVMSPLNRQWVSDQAVMAQNLPSVAAFTGIDEQWVQAQLKLADAVRQQLQDAIDLLAQSQEEQK
jgi:hypothetical protein